MEPAPRPEHVIAHFRVVAAADTTPAFGRNGQLLGALVGMIEAASGETQYGVLSVRNDPRRHMLVPIPWAILDRYDCGQRCIADVDRAKLFEAPHCTVAQLSRFDVEMASLIESAYGMEFPGLETLNDLA